MKKTNELNKQLDKQLYFTRAMFYHSFKKNGKKFNQTLLDLRLYLQIGWNAI